MTTATAQPDGSGSPRPVLTLNEVSCAFGPVLAADRVNLAMAPGEFVSLLGPSGCGKTTTLRMIAGFIAPTSGSIEMDGAVISSPAATLPPERRQMSMIFQSYAIWPNMTVAENVAFGLQLRRFDRDTIRRKVEAILKTVQMAALAERYMLEHQDDSIVADFRGVSGLLTKLLGAIRHRGSAGRMLYAENFW
jgi:ABC-type Fe3+/spermidine/putrescine transport system ATPase subunit